MLIIKVGEAFDERTFRLPGAVGEGSQCFSKKVRLVIRDFGRKKMDGRICAEILFLV
jgi:hypothetical protein